MEIISAWREITWCWMTLPCTIKHGSRAPKCTTQISLPLPGLSSDGAAGPCAVPPRLGGPRCCHGHQRLLRLSKLSHLNKLPQEASHWGEGGFCSRILIQAGQADYFPVSSRLCHFPDCRYTDEGIWAPRTRAYEELNNKKVRKDRSLRCAPASLADSMYNPLCTLYSCYTFTIWVRVTAHV